MDFKSEYEKLYQHWLKEFRQIELTPLTKEIYSSYQKAFDYINNYELNHEEKIKFEIVKSYKENFDFLINDFSKIREIKLINTALALKEIDLNKILDAEKLFYQNLVSAIKGFKKVKAIEVVEKAESGKIEEAVKLMKDDVDQPEKTDIGEVLPSDLNSKIKEEDFNYTLIRFLKKAPPLVGIDLINYGPFEKEDIANIPYKNAKILLAEKLAELINLS
jgi:DNA replication initiation complex subunit (GINS family)